MGSALLAPTHADDAVEVCSLNDGRPAILRRIGAADAPLLQAFVRGLSPAARRSRFQVGLRELNPALLATLMRTDRREHVALAAVTCRDGAETMVGEARYAPSREYEGSSEFAIAVADAWQHKGLGLALAEKLLRHARDSGIERIHGDVLRDNAGMLRLAQRLGFSLCRHPDGGWLARVTLDLRDGGGPEPVSPPRASAGVDPRAAARP